MTCNAGCSTDGPLPGQCCELNAGHNVSWWKKDFTEFIPKELLDQFVQGPMTAEANQDVSMAFKSALIERALGGELSHHCALRYRGWSSTTRTSLSAWGGHRVRG